jgi:transcriptional regulator with XRE-family HTH domain
MKAITPSEAVRSQMATIRNAKEPSWTAVALARRLKELGLPHLDQSTIAKIESNRRQLKIDEMLGLAAALDVAPVHLLVPVKKAQVQVVPTTTRTHAAGEVRAWIRGDRPLGGVVLDRDFFLDWQPDEVRGRRDMPGMAELVVQLTELAEAYVERDRERFEQVAESAAKSVQWIRDELAPKIPPERGS